MCIIEHAVADEGCTVGSFVVILIEFHCCPSISLLFLNVVFTCCRLIIAFLIAIILAGIWVFLYVQVAQQTALPDEDDDL